MKTFTQGLLAVIAISLIIGVVFVRTIFPEPLSKEATEKDFLKNQDSISIVTDYLVNSKYTNIYINNTDDSGVMFAGLENGTVTIEDPRVVDAIDVLLKKKGYSVIGKDKNTIHFQHSTRFRDFGSGVAYSIDGTEPRLEFLTLLETLSVANWYYYEEDFNDFKKRNGTSKGDGVVDNREQGEGSLVHD